MDRLGHVPAMQKRMTDEGAPVQEMQRMKEVDPLAVGNVGGALWGKADRRKRAQGERCFGYEKTETE